MRFCIQVRYNLTWKADFYNGYPESLILERPHFDSNKPQYVSTLLRSSPETAWHESIALEERANRFAYLSLSMKGLWSLSGYIDRIEKHEHYRQPQMQSPPDLFRSRVAIATFTTSIVKAIVDSIKIYTFYEFYFKKLIKTMCFIIILVFVILEAFLIKLMVKAWWKQCLFSLIILKRRVLIGKKAVEKTDRQKSKTSEFPFVNV
ncbi:hypothetical protein J3Q64DRAFT_1819553 [Phycomyces blakesleeanus]|uniref:Uncharacterized protein n=1 Tax=Phycomyces blakesleeanus TaxID=4837 RepID=A0ABR3B771_PHYBL